MRYVDNMKTRIALAAVTAAFASTMAATPAHAENLDDACVTYQQYMSTWIGMTKAKAHIALGSHGVQVSPWSLNGVLETVADYLNVDLVRSPKDRREVRRYVGCADSPDAMPAVILVEYNLANHRRIIASTYN